MYTHSQCLGLAEGGRTVTGTDWNYIEWTVQMSTDTVLLGNKLIPLKLQKLPDPTVTSRQCFVLCTFVICHYTAQWRHSNGDAENTRTWKWSENLVQLKEKKKAREQKSNILFKTFFSIFFSIFFFYVIKSMRMPHNETARSCSSKKADSPLRSVSFWSWPTCSQTPKAENGSNRPSVESQVFLSTSGS